MHRTPSIPSSSFGTNFACLLMGFVPRDLISGEPSAEEKAGVRTPLATALPMTSAGRFSPLGPRGIFNPNQLF